MIDVPTRHQSCGTLIKAVLRGGLFCCLSARSVRRLYMPVFFCSFRFTSRNNRTLAVKKMGERKNTSFLRPVNLFSTSSYFPVNRLPLRYPWAIFGRPLLCFRMTIRQISSSAASLHDMPTLACGASLVFVIQLQTPRTCPLRKPHAACK